MRLTTKATSVILTCVIVHVRGVDDMLWARFRAHATIHRQSLKAALAAALRLYLGDTPEKERKT